MQNVPYSIVRVDARKGSVVGYMVVSPYYAALQNLEGALLVVFPLGGVGRRLWPELTRLNTDMLPTPLDRATAEEAALLVEELTRGDGVILTLDTIQLASPDFAAERLQLELGEWITG